MSQINVIETKWQDNHTVLQNIRRQVFIEEQHVPEDLEWDDNDLTCEHFIAYVDNEAVGCARLTQGKKVGRMAVLRPFRTMGIGKAILEHIKQYAAHKRYAQLALSAQCHAYSFYQKCGFSACSQPYEDAGIAHIDMALTVSPENEPHESGLYEFGQDDAIHNGQSLLESEGFLDIMLGQTKRNIIICLKDLTHPLCRHEGLAQKIKQLARNNRNFKVYILLNHYVTQNNEHSLFRLQDRLPSFVEIRSTTDTIPCLWLMDNTAWFDFELTDSRACFSNRARVRYFMERFNKWWHNAKPIADARRLSI